MKDDSHVDCGLLFQPHIVPSFSSSASSTLLQDTCSSSTDSSKGTDNSKSHTVLGKYRLVVHQLNDAVTLAKNHMQNFLVVPPFSAWRYWKSNARETIDASPLVPMRSDSSRCEMLTVFSHFIGLSTLFQHKGAGQLWITQDFRIRQSRKLYVHELVLAQFNFWVFYKTLKIGR